MAAQNDEYVRNRVFLSETKLMPALKSLLNWSKDGDRDGDEGRLELEKINRDLDVLEVTMQKTLLEVEMNACEGDSYSTLYAEIEKDIQNAKQDIEQRREELVRAQQIRTNRMEYDAIAKVIKERTSRLELMSQIDKLSAELGELERVGNVLDTKLETRRKQFYLLMHTVYEIRRSLEAEEEEVGEDDKPEEAKQEVAKPLESASMDETA